MAFRCPSCGGSLYYSVPDGQLKCENCGTLQDPETYQVDNSAEEQAAEEQAAETDDSYQVTIYTCRNCGAQLVSPDHSAVAFCSYCGSEQVLDGKLTREKKPAGILPFTISKEEARRHFAETAGRVLYLPKEMKSPEFIEKFRGTYIPYWMHEVEIDRQPEFDASRRERTGSQEWMVDYRLKTRVRGNFAGIPVDASSSFDDTVSDKLMPFDIREMRKFRPAYLAGFYADRADVEDADYQEEVRRRSVDSAYSRVQQDLGAQGYILKNGSAQERDEKLEPGRADSHGALFPVWFLTWRKKDRVAYMIMNGQNGRMTADLPVDLKAFAAGTAVTTVVFFVLLTAFVSMTARTALAICAALALASMFFFSGESREIRDRENHIGDPGYFSHGARVAMPEEERERLTSKRIEWERKHPDGGGAVGGLQPALIASVIAVLFALLLPSMVGAVFLPSSLLKLQAVIFLIAGIAVTGITGKYLKYVSEKSMKTVNLAGLAGLAVTLVTAVIDPVSDIWYYGAAAVCILCAALNCMGLIRSYNLLSTRPIPGFFDREGGRDDAKD